MSLLFFLLLWRYVTHLQQDGTDNPLSESATNLDLLVTSTGDSYNGSVKPMLCPSKPALPSSVTEIGSPELFVKACHGSCLRRALVALPPGFCRSE